MATTMHMPQSASVRAVGGLDVLAGIWLVIAPFLFDYSANGGSTVNSVVVGVAVLLLAGVQMSGGGRQMSWPSWLAAVLGVWLLIAPFALNYPSGVSAVWSDVIAGAVIAIVSLVGALAVAPEE